MLDKSFFFFKHISLVFYLSKIDGKNKILPALVSQSFSGEILLQSAEIVFVGWTASLKKIGWNVNPKNLWMWPYLDIRL